VFLFAIVGAFIRRKINNNVSVIEINSNVALQPNYQQSN